MNQDYNSSENLNMKILSSDRGKSVIDGQSTKFALNECKNIDQLMEYETVVSSAEKKCTQLKGQIDQIKQIYNNHYEGANTPVTLFTDSNSTKRKTVLYTDNNNHTGLKSAKKVRQNSQAIETDTSGAALGTLNNILVEITKPMETSEFFIQEKKKCGTVVQGPSKIQTHRYYQDQLHGVEEVEINSKSRHSLYNKLKSSKCNAKKSKSKVGTMISLTNLKKNKKLSLKTPKDKSKIPDFEITKSCVPTMNKHSRKILLKQRFTLQNGKQNYAIRNQEDLNGDLVEIYHNNAVKESKSSESDILKKKTEKINKMETNIKLVPPLTITENENDGMYNQSNLIRSGSKNYTLPTISSRMKRVAKIYMNSFNNKAIPFCLSTSTSPSHNIGFNIQQVMSMIKSKQPFAKLSPTLAYNIGLAAGKNDEYSFPLLLSSVTSRNFYSQCPLAKSNFHYQQMQEIARTIPQDIIEVDEQELQSPETESVIITGPSGDVRLKNRKQTVWTANVNEKSCTCVPQKGMGFQQIINKFNGIKPVVNTPSIHMTKYKDKRNECVTCGIEHINHSENMIPLQNKEKKLKDVLRKLHDEFEKMTKTYDDLAKKTEEGTPSSEVLTKLESLDKELNSKEEEIVMVMSLYKEVTALKQQVKSLKSRTSKDNICFRKQQQKPSSCNNIITAGVLNKLLQQVQHFQTHYKKS